MTYPLAVFILVCAAAGYATHRNSLRLWFKQPNESLQERALWRGIRRFDFLSILAFGIYLIGLTYGEWTPLLTWLVPALYLVYCAGTAFLDAKIATQETAYPSKK